MRQTEESGRWATFGLVHDDPIQARVQERLSSRARRIQGARPRTTKVQFGLEPGSGMRPRALGSIALDDERRAVSISGFGRQNG